MKAQAEILYMNPNTGSIGTYDEWFYEDENGDVFNAVDLKEVVALKTKEEAIEELLESGSAYVRTNISQEACAVEIAINDIKGVDDRLYNEKQPFWFEACSTGLDWEDY